jgi:hypothetical protein
VDRARPGAGPGQFGDDHELIVGAVALMRHKRSRKVEAHPRLWSVVVFHGEGRGLVGLYQTKAEADAIARKGRGRFVLPPRNAWAGKTDTAGAK